MAIPNPTLAGDRHLCNVAVEGGSKVQNFGVGPIDLFGNGINALGSIIIIKILRVATTAAGGNMAKQDPYPTVGHIGAGPRVPPGRVSGSTPAWATSCPEESSATGIAGAGRGSVVC